MNKKRWLAMVLVGFFVVTIASMAAQDAPQASETRIIRIQDTGLPISKVVLEPKYMQISKDTVVVWMNWAKEEIRVVFAEGKKCEDVTEAPVSFELDAENCYVTSFISYGGTSSLKFNEPGTFAFEVITKGDVKAEGKIVVGP